MLDKLSIHLPQEELDRVETVYQEALGLLVEFIFDSALPIPEKDVAPLSRVLDFTRHQLTVFCDFDKACAVHDSSFAMIEEISIKKVPRSNTQGSLAQFSSADIKSFWNVISTEYTDNLKKCEKIILTGEKVEGFRYKELCSALEKIGVLERKANDRVVDAGLLEGITLSVIQQAGLQARLRRGCRSFFQRILNNKDLRTHVHIVSYCWCQEIITSAFSPGGNLNGLTVHSNQLKYKKAITTGQIIRKVESPREKLQIFITEHRKASEKDKSNLSVYIGGSVGDLLCLLQADIGIVIGESVALKRIGDHFGVTFAPLFPSLVKKQRQFSATKEGSSQWKPMSGTLYTVSNWAEIHAFILGGLLPTEHE